MSDLMLETPTSYAKRLAGYISSPTKIESLTRIEFGRAPPLHVIARMRLLVEEQNHSRTDIGEPEANDALDFSVRTFVPKKQPKPERVVDYIVIEPTRTDNPFMGLYSTGKRLIASVAEDFSITPQDITGPRRWQEFVDARATVAALLKRWGRHSYPQIGRMMNRDHSTVIHNAGNIDIVCERNPTALASYERHLKLIEEAEMVAREASGELLSDEPTGANSTGSAEPVDNAA